MRVNTYGNRPHSVIMHSCRSEVFKQTPGRAVNDLNSICKVKNVLNNIFNNIFNLLYKAVMDGFSLANHTCMAIKCFFVFFCCTIPQLFLTRLSLSLCSFFHLHFKSFIVAFSSFSITA